MRILVGTVIALVVLLVGGFIALSRVDWNKYVAQAAAEVKQTTGRELKVGGRIDIGLLPPRVIVEDVSFANAPWGSRPEMVKAKRVEARAALFPLLIGRIRLKLDVVEPDVLLETNARGIGNWVIGSRGKGSKTAAASESGGSLLDLETVRITKGVVRFHSGRSGKTHRLALEDARMRDTRLFGREIVIKARVDNMPVSLVAKTDDSLIQTLAVGESLGVTLNAKLADSSLAASGRIGFPATGPELALKVHAIVADPASLAKIAGAHIPHLKPVTVDAQIKGEKRIYTADGVRLSVGESNASGTLKADLTGARPRLAAKVSAPLVDLRDLRATETAAGGKAAGASERIFSSEPLPLAALNAVDVDADLKINKLVLPPALLFEGLHGRIVLDRGKLTTRSLATQMGGGNVKLAAVLDASGAKQARLDANVAGSDVDLGKMLAELGNEDFMTGGRTEVQAELHANGTSPATLAAALDGHVRIVMGPARTRNRVLDRAGMDILTQVLNAVNPTRKTQQYTQIQCAVVNVPVRDGVVTVDRTVAVETTEVGVAMAGTVNLAKETIDLSIRPQAKGGIGVGLGDLANLVKITGTLADPRVGVDIAGAASTAAEVGLGVMTSGLSLLAKGLFDKATMEAPCKTALQRGGAPPGETQSAPPAGQPASGGIGGFFERLFK